MMGGADTSGRLIMTQFLSGDSQAGNDVGGFAVVEWNGDGERRERRLATPLPQLIRSRWLVVLFAALGAIAIFGSFLTEWQVTELRFPVEMPDPEAQQRQLQVGLTALGGWTSAYLVGVFTVTACLALLLFGPRSGRGHLRVVGLAVAGVLFAMLVALMFQIRDSSVALGGINLPVLAEDWANGWAPRSIDIDLSYGRGLTAAVVGVACHTLALLLIGLPGPAYEADIDDLPADGSAPDTDQIWPRPRTAHDGDRDPLDLTVEPTKPFVSP